MLTSVRAWVQLFLVIFKKDINDLLYINIKKNNQGRPIIDIFPVVTMKVVEDSNKWSSLKVLLEQCMITK